MENINLVGKSGIYTESSETGLRVESSFPQIINPPRIFVTSEVSPIPYNIPCVYFEIRADINNTQPVFVRGIGDDANQPATERGKLIYPGELIPILLDNTNKASLVTPSGVQKIWITCYPNTANEVTGINYTEPDTPDIVAPTVSSTTPADTATGIEIDAEITFDFSEAIDPDSVTASTFTISPSVSVTRFVDSIDPSKVIMRPDSDLSTSTVYTITATTGITDLAGNALASNHQISFTTASGGPPPDVTPPTISSRTPAPGATTVAVSSNVTVVFDEQIDVSTVNINTFKLKKVSTGTFEDIDVSLGPDNKTVTIDPINNLDFSKQYEVTVVGGVSDPRVKDLAGNALAASSVWTFTTIAPSYTLLYNVNNDGTTERLSSTLRIEVGMRITSSAHACFNKSMNRVIVRMREVGTHGGSETLDVVVTNSTGTVIATIGSMLVNDITDSSSGAEYTFENPEITYQMQVNDMILVRFSDGDSSNFVRIFEQDSDIIAGCHEVNRDADETSYDDRTGEDFAARIYTVM